MGLKPETADMKLVYNIFSKTYEPLPKAFPTDNKYDAHAWSLHRLMEIRFAGDNIGLGVYNIHNRNFGNCYEILISVIEHLIEIGEFNKEYLKQ